MSSFYAVIPTNVLFNVDLKPNEKLLYGVLVSLANERGEVYQTNQEIADLYLSHGHDCSSKTVSGWVNNIIQMKLFSAELKSNNTRTLKITHNPLLPVNRPNDTRTQGYEYTQEIMDVMDYYTEVVGSTPTLSKPTVTNMINHFKNGKKVIDFKKVIAVKSVDPWFIENPQYMLPTTLFRPQNFVKYVNEYDIKQGSAQPQSGSKDVVLTNEEF